MNIKEQINIKEITTNYFNCNIVKVEEDLKIIFDNIEIIFDSYLIFKCGYPNEEIYIHLDFYIQNNPKKYYLYELLDSPWIKELINTNKVHHRNLDGIIFNNDKHFIIYYEDEIFECIANNYRIVPTGAIIQ